MKNNLTEIVFILDRSGSMGGVEDETIKGYNSFITRQKGDEGEGVLSTILFDNQIETLHNRVSLKEVKPITEKDYFVRGTTALYDAVGSSISQIGLKLSETVEEDRPSKVIFVIATDGHENASHLYTRKDIKEMITHQRTKYSWEFIFLGANIDAIGTAEDIGIAKERAVNYAPTEEGTSTNFKSMADTVSTYRQSGIIEDNWSSDIKVVHERSKKPKAK